MRVVHVSYKHIFALGYVVLVLFVLMHFMHTNYLISSVSQSMRLLPIYKVDTPEQQVAISFDASWGAEHTKEILDILDRYQVKTTFFLVDIWIKDYPDMAKEIVARGHEIGLHSATHPHFTQLSTAEMEEELKSNAQTIFNTTGFQPVLFRPPFGDYNNSVISTTEALGYTAIQWSVDSLDWKDLSAVDIQNRVLKRIGPGDIVLFHNNGKHTAEALPAILDALKQKNLSVVPISQLLLKGDYYIDYNGIQRQKPASSANDVELTISP